MKDRELSDLDPQWAWSPWRPTDDNPWNVAAAAHLYRRAGFAANKRQLQEAVARDPLEVVQEIADSQEPSTFQKETESLEQAMVNTGNVRNLAAVWIHRMLASPCQLREKMTLFWHGHFATSGDKVQDPAIMLAQHRLLRREALGDFSVLTEEISRDPAMLMYLDSATNRKAHPNENYARELMELFCMGEGNYSEQDIRELARCFTGWHIKRKQFRFSRYDHDFGDKTIFGATGAYGGEEAVQLVLQHPATPYFIVGKLFRFFVMDEPQPSRELLQPLADLFRQTGRIHDVVQRLLSSQMLFWPGCRARKVRSPIELACGLLRALEGSTNTRRLSELTGEVGQALFFPPNVKGWDGGRTWINSSTLLGRANLVHEVLHSDKTRFQAMGLGDYLKSQGLQEPEELVDRLIEMLLAVDPPADVRRSLLDLASEGDLASDARAAKVVHALSAIPEFQLA